MKKGLAILVFTLVSTMAFPALSLRENPQDPPRGKKRHIKMVKVEDGEKTELDTIIEGDDIFVWKGDTIGKDLKWITSEDKEFNLDSLKKSGVYEYDVDVLKGGKGKVLMYSTGDDNTSKLHEYIIKSGEGKKMMFIGEDDNIHEFKGPGDAVWVTEKGDHTMLHAPSAVKIIKEKQGGNIIDLSDPGIISYKKKKLSGGREKIEIIREEAKKGEIEDVNVVIKEADGPMMIHSAQPGMTKNIKVLKKDNGVFHIFEEDGEELEFTDKEGNLVKVKEINKGDGNLIHIKEIEEDGLKKVKVTVKEVEEEAEEKEEVGKESENKK